MNISRSWVDRIGVWRMEQRADFGEELFQARRGDDDEHDFHGIHWLWPIASSRTESTKLTSAGVMFIGGAKRRV